MNRPVFKAELSHLSVAVFENENDRSVMRSISVSRRYYDRNSDQWKTSSASLNTSDVPAITQLLQAVTDWLINNPKEVTDAD